MINFLKKNKKYLIFLFKFFNYFFVNKERKKKYKADFDKIIKMLVNNENFAFSRFSDGELFMIKDVPILIKENETYLGGKLFGIANYTKEEIKEYDPKLHQKYRKLLITCLKHSQKNYFKGISCSCCNGKEHVDFMKRFSDDNFTTFSNLLFNRNYEAFLDNVKFIFPKKKIILVINKFAKTSNLPFNCIKIFKVGENCMVNDFSLIRKMQNFIESEKIKNHIFLFSAGSLSNFLIYKLFKKYKFNTYIDIGSALNPYCELKGWRETRGYLQEYWLDKKPKLSSSYGCYW